MAEFLIETIGLPPWLSWTAIAVCRLFYSQCDSWRGTCFHLGGKKIAARIQDRRGRQDQAGVWLATVTS